MILVENRHHRKRKLASGIVSEILRYADQFYASRTQLRARLHVVERVPEQTRERVGDDDLEFSVARVGQHLLVYAPRGRGGAGARLDICLYDRTALVRSEGLTPRYLVGDRHIVISLLGRAYTRIDRDLLSVEPVHIFVLLRHGNQLYAEEAKLRPCLRVVDRISGQPRWRMQNDCFELTPTCISHHLLICAGTGSGETRAELDICSNDRATHIHSERLATRYLIGDRFVVIGLLGRANPRVNRDLFSVQPIHLDDPYSHLTCSNSAAISAPMS
ncbi:hypothetical protein AAG604_04180 [Citromicrobium bathyomarinum]